MQLGALRPIRNDKLAQGNRAAYAALFQIPQDAALDLFHFRRHRQMVLHPCLHACTKLLLQHKTLGRRRVRDALPLDSQFIGVSVTLGLAPVRVNDCETAGAGIY